MGVHRQLLGGQRYRLHPAGLAQYETAALVHRHPGLQVRQCEGLLAIAAVGGADEVEQRVVLGDGQELALAEQPADRREVAAEHPDLTDVGITHSTFSSSVSGLKTAWNSRPSASARTGTRKIGAGGKSSRTSR